MQSIYRILAIAKKDIKESFKNRTALMVILLPLIASLMFSLVSSRELVQEYELGITGQADGELASFISQQYQNIYVEDFNNSQLGKKALQDGNVDGLIEVDEQAEHLSRRYRVLLDARNTVSFFLLRENVKMILYDYHGIEAGPELNFVSVSNTEVRSSLLPIWLTVTLTMIGVMIVSGSFAEEKDNNTMAAIVMTPARPGELLAGKAVLGVFLSVIASTLMGFLNQAFTGSIDQILANLILVLSGGFCFTMLGLLIGLFTNTQASARSLATIIYFPIIFPALIADVSNFTRKIARFFPTYYLHEGLKQNLVYKAGVKGILLEAGILFSIALLLFIFLIFFLRKVDTLGYEN